METGSALSHKHFQMAVKGHSIGFPMLNKKMKVLLGLERESSDGSCCVMQGVEG